MTRGRRAAILAGVLLLAPVAGQAASAAVDPEVMEALKTSILGPPEDVPTLWGADPMGYDPNAALGMSLFAEEPAPTTAPARAGPAAATAAAQPAQQPAPAQSRAADQVGGIVVQAAPNRSAAAQTVDRCVTGPAWWRVTNGKTTLWIMGTPDQMPMDTVWDDTCLQKRLAAARVAIVPAIFSGGAPSTTQLKPATLPLDQRLPPALWRQLSVRLENNAVRARDEMAAAGLTRPKPTTTAAGPPPPPSKIAPPAVVSVAQLRMGVIASTPILYAPTIIVARRMAQSLNLVGVLGNPAASRAVDLAGRANMLIVRTQNTEAQFSNLTRAANPSEADQVTCLQKVVNELDAGHTGLGVQPLIQAWAQGDYRNGLQRMNVLDTCPLGDISARFWSSLVAQDMALIDRAMKAGGVAVAVLEFDPMFIKGGVMDRLKAEGFTITQPEDMR